MKMKITKTGQQPHPLLWSWIALGAIVLLCIDTIVPITFGVMGWNPFR